MAKYGQAATIATDKKVRKPAHEKKNPHANDLWRERKHARNNADLPKLEKQLQWRVQSLTNPGHLNDKQRAELARIQTEVN
jgi:hypothetical protein